MLYDRYGISKYYEYDPDRIVLKAQISKKPKFYDMYLSSEGKLTPSEALHRIRLHFIRENRKPGFWGTLCDGGAVILKDSDTGKDEE